MCRHIQYLDDQDWFHCKANTTGLDFHQISATKVTKQKWLWLSGTRYVQYTISIYIYIYSVYTYTLYPLVDRVVTPKIVVTPQTIGFKRSCGFRGKNGRSRVPKTNLRSQILASKEISSLPFSWDSKKTALSIPRDSTLNPKEEVFTLLKR